MFRLRLADDLDLALFEDHHVARLSALVEENRAHLQRFMAWARSSDPEKERAFVRAGLEQFARGNGFAAGLLVDGVLAGSIGLHYVDRATGSTELGYWIGARWEGRGIMTRALEGLLRVLYEEYGMYRVEIRCRPDNLRSRRVAERLGFRHEGTLRAVYAEGEGEPSDLEVFGLLRHEWEQRGGAGAAPDGAGREASTTVRDISGGARGGRGGSGPGRI